MCPDKPVDAGNTKEQPTVDLSLNSATINSLLSGSHSANNCKIKTQSRDSGINIHSADTVRKIVQSSSSSKEDYGKTMVNIDAYVLSFPKLNNISYVGYN